MLINDIFYNNPLSVFETKKLKKALTVKNWRGLDSEKLIFYYCYFCNDVFAKKEIGKVALEKLQLEVKRKGDIYNVVIYISPPFLVKR